MRPRTILAALAPFLALWIASAGLAAEKSALSEEVRQLASAPGLKGMRVGIRVESLGPEGTVIYQQNEGEQFKPASNQKIVTTSAAMTLLPADFTYRTILGMRGDDLVVIGAGDPSIGDSMLSKAAKEPRTAVFQRWAAELKKKGITSIKGNLVFDDFVFEQDFINPTWKGQFDSQVPYAAGVGGLNLNDNCVEVLVSPDEGGKAPEVTLVPENPWVKIDNRAKSGKGGQPVIRMATSRPYTIQVTGTVSKASGSDGVLVAVSDPGEFFANALYASLVSQGIPIAGQVRRERVWPEGADVPASVQVIAVHERKLSEILWRIDKSSLNVFAEAVLKTIGAYAGRTGAPGLGSYETGREAVKRYLSQIEVPANSYVIADGSGLSHSNRVTPLEITKILRFMDSSPRREAWLSNLAVPGEQEGTLRRRMKDLKDKVRAKTGYISGVSALSGYVEGPGGRRYAFSVLCNDFNKAKGGLDAARKLEDSLCHVLATWGGSGASTAKADSDAPEKTDTTTKPAAKTRARKATRG